MSERSDKTQQLLDDLYDAMAAECRSELEVTLTPYFGPNTRGNTLYLIPIDSVSLEPAGKRGTLTSLVDEELDDFGDDFDRYGVDLDGVQPLAGFAVELEQCVAKIRAFLAKCEAEAAEGQG
jgi:hypothetical protein